VILPDSSTVDKSVRQKEGLSQRLRCCHSRHKDRACGHSLEMAPGSTARLSRCSAWREGREEVEDTQPGPLQDMPVKRQKEPSHLTSPPPSLLF
jgi:hypothetical protein